MCCNINVCKSCCTHCWHSTHNGVWYGTVPPDVVCCHCGILQSQLHGPFKPTQYCGNWITTNGTISITGNSQITLTTDKLKITNG